MAKRIMLIDKDPAVVDVITFILQDEGYDIIVSNDPFNIEEVLKMIPDLILLHSGLNDKGLHFCLEIKSHQLLSKIPVIISSTKVDIPILAPLFKADQFLLKPFDINHLCDLIKATMN